MPRFLVDENLPRSLAPTSRSAGIVAEDVRDSGYRGRTDEDIFEYASDAGLALVTADVGFGGVVWLSQRQHLGVHREIPK